MATLTVQGTGVNDVEILSNVATTNRDGYYLKLGEYSSSLGRVLLKFDLSSIPSSATISSAVLTLTYALDESSNARTISVYRVLRNWVETQATWNSYSTGNAWATAGCANTTSDRESSNIGTATQPASPTIDATLEITLTAEKIQEMITDGVFTNNGFLLQVDTESSDAITYYDTNQATVSYKPKLVVTYTEPVTSNFLTMF